MELLKFFQKTDYNCCSVQYDIFIYVDEDNARCHNLKSKINIKNAYELGIKYKNSSVSLFQKKITNVKSLYLNSNETVLLKEKLTNAIEDRKLFTNRINIFVDISCMSKLWYAAIISTLLEYEDYPGEIQLDFGYTPVKYPYFNKSRKVRNVSSIFDTYGSKHNKPKALVVGLGCEDHVAEKLISSMKPSEVHFFIADPAFDDYYKQCVFERYGRLLEKYSIKNLHTYHASDLNDINCKLTALCLDLRLDYSVTIAPMGPKTFVLSSIMFSLRYPDVELIDSLSEIKPMSITSNDLLAPVFFSAEFQMEQQEVCY